MTLHAGAVHKHCRSRYYMAKTPKPIPTVCSPSRNPLKLKLVRSQSIRAAFLTPPRHVCAHAHTHTYTHSHPCAAFICLVPYASTTTSGIWCFRASQSDARPTAIPETLSIEVYTHFLGEHTHTHTHNSYTCGTTARTRERCKISFARSTRRTTTTTTGLSVHPATHRTHSPRPQQSCLNS